MEQANEIIQRFKVELKNSSQDGPRAVSTRHVPRRNDADEIHIQRVLKLIDIKAIRAAKLRVVVDSVNGSGCNAVRVMLQELGVHLEHLNGVVTGQFAHTPTCINLRAPWRKVVFPAVSLKIQTPIDLRLWMRTAATLARNTRWRCARCACSNARGPVPWPPISAPVA